MRLFRSRTWRTLILFVAGLGAAYVLARIFAPAWPGLCDDVIVGASCDAVAIQTMTGYLIVVLGIATIILGPIAGSLIDLAVNGHTWETPRGTENVVTNMPLLVGGIYLVIGVLVAASA